MKNFTQQLKTTILLSVLVLLAITVKAQNDYFIKTDGTKVNVYGEVATFDAGTFIYVNENGEKIKINENKIKLVKVGSNVLISLALSKKDKKTRFFNISAFNDKYVLATWSTDMYTYMNILDREFNFISDDVIKILNISDRVKTVNNSIKKLIEKNVITLNETVFKYFNDCPELREKMLKNVNDFKTYNVCSGIKYYNCNNAPDLLTNKKVKSSEVNQELTVKKVRMNFYVNTKNEKIEMKEYHVVALNEKFKYAIGSTWADVKSTPSEEVKYANFENIIYAPINFEGKKYMVEIIGFNNNFVLFGRYETKFSNLVKSRVSLGIYDRKSNSVIDEVEEGANLNPFLDKYFKDCTDLKNIINVNLKNQRNASFGFTYYKCNGAKEFIEGIKFE